jgi:nucleoid DNA-binding protein
MKITGKPKSMSVLHWLSKKMALNNIGGTEDVITKVINHQFSSTYEAMRTNDSVEISGFCKFYFNTKRYEKQIIKLSQKKEELEVKYEKAVSDKYKDGIKEKLEETVKILNHLLERKNGKSKGNI